MNQEKIGMFISENRKKQNITQEELAEKLNVSKNAVSKWERGINLPDASIMKTLCRILKITLNELFDGEYENLELINITKEYEKKNEKIIAIDNINYTFEQGKLYAIMGRSGSGKTTLLNILGTLDKQTSGQYYINGENISEFDEKKLSQTRKKEIGFIFQNFSLDQNLKAFENVMLPMYINDKIKKEDRKKKAIELLKYVDLDDRLNHFPNELSGGEQQRVAIARALSNNPNVLIADEPTGNLDEINEEKIFNIFKKLSEEGKCVIIVTHSDNIIKYANSVLYLKNGKLGVYNE